MGTIKRQTWSELFTSDCQNNDFNWQSVTNKSKPI